MRTMTGRLSVLAGLFLGWVWSPPVRAQPDPVIQAVEQAWKARQERLRTIRIAWEATVTIFRGGHTDATGSKSKDGSPFPPADHRHVKRYEMAFDGDKVRLEHNGPVANVMRGEWLHVHYTQVYDGTTGLAYQDQPHMRSPIYTATREVGAAPTQLRMTTLFPVLETVRPATPALSVIDLSRFRNSGRKVRIGGRECLELAFVTKTGKGSSSLWVDVGRGYALVRIHTVYAHKNSPYAAIQEDIDYQEAAPDVWVPRGWTTICKGWGVPVSSKTVATVTAVELPATIPAARFDTTPPPRSIVTERDGESRSTYVVRSDGTRETIDPAQFSGPIDGPTTTGRTSWWRNRHLVVGSAAVLMCVAIAVWSRRKRPVRAA